MTRPEGLLLINDELNWNKFIIDWLINGFQRENLELQEKQKMLLLEKNELEMQLGHCFREKQFAQDKSGKYLMLFLTSNLSHIQLKKEALLIPN